MGVLQKCSLCANMEDPRFRAEANGRVYPLCDGCGGPETSMEAVALFEKLTASALRRATQMPNVVPHINFAETASTTVGSHHPVNTSVVPTGSAACPICGERHAHAHDDRDVGRWASNQVARWGYRAVVVAISAPDPHETIRELRADGARQVQAYDASWAHVQARLRELEREVSEWHEASEVLGGVTPDALRAQLVGLMARAERSNELPGLTATLDELRNDLAEAERHHVEHHERENAKAPPSSSPDEGRRIEIVRGIIATLASALERLDGHDAMSNPVLVERSRDDVDEALCALRNAFAIWGST